MKVTLINYTKDAAELLIFTKNTRLKMNPKMLDEIKEWGEAAKEDELAYIASTIPSSWEFVDYVFAIEGVSRAFTHQFVRTRAGSYAQQTMRVLDMGLYEYIPTTANKASDQAMAIINDINRKIRGAYHDLLGVGQSVEDARGILPTNISTNIVCKFDLRTLSGLAKSRTGGRTQDEYKQIINAMIDAVVQVHPWAEQFLFQRGRGYFDELEMFAAGTKNNDQRVKLLKIIDHMRQV